ncbi:MAG: tetratricopeptide repeat protein [Caulobacteraceae bacterium]|nr:tetratricopeptide repeat protein [Caulobacteraceae bacterium]
MTLEESCDALLKLGLLHHREHRLEQARTVYSAILRVRPDHADSLHLLGVIAYQEGRTDEAIGLIAQALRLNERRADYASNLGNALQRAARLSDAEDCYRAALALDPDNPTAHNNLGAVLHEQGRPAEALAHCQAALALRPDYVDAHNNLAIAQADCGQFEQSAASARAALALQPQRIETRNNLGIILSHLGRFDEALAEFEAALADKPDSAEIRHNLGMTLLKMGRFEEGWREYEWRWRTRQLGPSRRDFPQPLWDGSPLDGRTLLIHAEQGFGDTLQFCRYAARVAGQVLLEVPPALAGLLEGQLGGCTVIRRGDPLPDFDTHCPMLSLPALIEPAPDAAANAKPYLRADPGRTAAWRTRLENLPGLRVGLVWAGGKRPGQPVLGIIDGRRSMSLSTLAPLADVAGVSWVSLQKGPPAAQTQHPPPGLELHDFTAELDDFAETAALVEGLDLVISVDTAVAHLAGALGKPVWLLNRFDSCWRWRTGRTDSAWYPTLTQFRQPQPGDWTSVVGEVAAALARAAGPRQ